MRATLRAALAALAITAATIVPAAAFAAVEPQPGDLIKVEGNTSVYYYGADYKRYVFPNDATYHTWYGNFDTVKVIGYEQLTLMPIGGNVTYKPGSRMVKITSSPTVYAVSKNGILRPIASEAVAAALYGSNWNKMIDDVPDAFFVNYRVGAPVTVAADYNRPGLTGGVPSIDVDKRLVAPPTGYIDFASTVGFTPADITVSKGTAVTWIALDDSIPAVTPTPLPNQQTLSGFGTTEIPMGQTWSFTFSEVGAWGYQNRNYVNQHGTITVK